MTQMALFYSYAMALFWSPLTGSTAHFHLRTVILLKSCSFAFNALQLRNGYPPPASYQCAPQTLSLEPYHPIAPPLPAPRLLSVRPGNPIP